MPCTGIVVTEERNCPSLNSKTALADKWQRVCAMRIDFRKGVLNSKSVYSRNRLPRVKIEQTDWEKEREVEEKKRKRREKLH